MNKELPGRHYLDAIKAVEEWLEETGQEIRSPQDKRDLVEALVDTYWEEHGGVECDQRFWDKAALAALAACGNMAGEPEDVAQRVADIAECLVDQRNIRIHDHKRAAEDDALA